MAHRVHRREFLGAGAVIGAGYFIGNTALGADNDKSPSEKLNIACVGVGGKGESDMGDCANGGQNIVAICDVDDNTLNKAASKHPKAKKFNDYRKMLDEMHGQIDAVTVSTPDHMHAPAAMMAMKLGKHAYVQKPLCHSVYEARMLRETATKMKVATQMGNQGTAETGLRKAVELIQSGAIGGVKEVHVWTNRPIWKQGQGRPAGSKPVPANLHWDEWLGVAPDRPYNDGYHPFAWRGFWDFGTGALGDMACHTANMAFMGLKLGYPTSIEAESSGINPETAPKWSVITFQFPARGDMPACKFVWYDGGKLPASDLAQGQKITGSGSLLVGDKATLFSPNDYGAESFILAGGEAKKVTGRPEKLPVSIGHSKEWQVACKGGPAGLSNFDYAAFLTETILLGNVALRVGKKVEWDGPNMKSPNCPEADQYIKREYRKGYTL